MLFRSHVAPQDILIHSFQNMDRILWRFVLIVMMGLIVQKDRRFQGVVHQIIIVQNLLAQVSEFSQLLTGDIGVTAVVISILAVLHEPVVNVVRLAPVPDLDTHFRSRVCVRPAPCVTGIKNQLVYVVMEQVKTVIEVVLGCGEQFGVEVLVKSHYLRPLSL